jgi:hypothetical protein
VSRKRPELWPNDWIFHHDNAPAHKAPSVKQFLAQKIDYWNGTPALFLWFGCDWLLTVSGNKVRLKGMKIQDTEDIQKERDEVTETYSWTGVPKMCRILGLSVWLLCHKYCTCMHQCEKSNRNTLLGFIMKVALLLLHLPTWLFPLIEILPDKFYQILIFFFIF